MLPQKGGWEERDVLKGGWVERDVLKAEWVERDVLKGRLGRKRCFKRGNG